MTSRYSLIAGFNLFSTDTLYSPWPRELAPSGKPRALTVCPLRLHGPLHLALTSEAAAYALMFSLGQAYPRIPFWVARYVRPQPTPTTALGLAAATYTPPQPRSGPLTAVSRYLSPDTGEGPTATQRLSARVPDPIMPNYQGLWGVTPIRTRPKYNFDDYLYPLTVEAWEGPGAFELEPRSLLRLGTPSVAAKYSGYNYLRTVTPI